MLLSKIMDNKNKCGKTSKKLSPVHSKKKYGTKKVTMNNKLDMWLLKKGVINKFNIEGDSKTKLNGIKSEMDQGLEEIAEFRNRLSKESASVSRPRETVKQRGLSLNGTKSEKDQGSKENAEFRSKLPKKSASVSRPRKTVKQRESSLKHDRQSVLESFIHKEQRSSKSKAIRKTSSNESCDLPSFKITKTVSKGNKLYKKYGVILPSVDEVLQEKKELELYKNKLETVHDICMLNKVLSSPLKNQQVCLKQHNQILDCKHLALKKISRAVKNNLDDLKDIMCGKVFNERHKKFSDRYKKILTLTTKDLTYNTSMVLFTYDQVEYMLTKLKKYLDPEDKLTEYFFKVLLPELCLKIFMQTHNMGYDDAVVYLDSRPFVEIG